MKLLQLSFLLLFLLILRTVSYGQSQKKKKDTSNYVAQVVELSPLILRANIDVPLLIHKLRKDTTFYKAFKNLNITNYISTVNGTMYDRKEDVQATISSKIKQTVEKDCVTKSVIEEKITGRVRNRKGDWNYLTCKIFGNFFLKPGMECNKTNIIAQEGETPFSLKKKEGLAKRIEQIKMLVFNPGQRIPQFMYFGSKVALFEKHIAKLYDYKIDRSTYKNKDCILLTIKAKEDLNIFQKTNVVIDELITWMDVDTWEIVARTYSLSYNLGIVKFSIYMDVELSDFRDYSIPSTIRYQGRWKVPFYKNENGIFNVTIHPYKIEEKSVKGR